MKASTAASSEERVNAGYEKVRLVGRASPPFYDQASHKLHWAKEVQFGDDAEHTLNYDVRALGRRGVLQMSFISTIGELKQIRSIIPSIMAMPEFKESWRYEDYVPGADKIAAYGIGGLIVGKVLSKAVFLCRRWHF